MNKQIKQSILSGLAFSGTVLFSYLGFAVWTDLPTQVDNTPLNASIWNQVITTVNNIGKSQLGVDQTRLQVEQAEYLLLQPHNIQIIRENP
ncbi:MAG: hypothetical protein PHG82_01595 [Candidatus Gracilibacteria bacterium]|nr:hypothetical protein [Candidatus Gracilibacteria bacterium]